jgi:hypothetical protein
MRRLLLASSTGSFFFYPEDGGNRFIRNTFTFCEDFTMLQWAAIAPPVKRLAVDWKVRGSNPVEGEIFRTRSDRSGGSPSLLYSGYWVISGGKTDRAWKVPRCNVLRYYTPEDRMLTLVIFTRSPDYPLKFATSRK